MDVKLPGGLRHVQTVLEELINGRKRLLVKIVRGLAVKDFLDEHPAQRKRQLIDQTADSKPAVRHHVLRAVENFAYIQSHLGFLVRAGYVLDLIDNRSKRYVYLGHGLRIQHI